MMTTVPARSRTMPLSPGAVWRGSQTSGPTSYDVEVRICSIDDKGDVCGTLTIRNLTPALPKLVTLFDGEIIGDHHSLVEAKWGATDEDDEVHWSRFKRDFGLPGLDDIHAPLPEDVVFMRLKERCIVDVEGSNRDVSGASFAGFYYIAVKLNPSPTFSDACEEPVELFGSRVRSLSGASNGCMTSLSAFASSLLASPATSSKPPTESLLSESLRTVRRASNSATSLVRMNSYAAVVRGRSASIREMTKEDEVTSAAFIKADELSPASPSMASILAISPPPPYSPSLDDFPPPSSPSPTRTAGSFFPRSPTPPRSTRRRCVSTEKTPLRAPSLNPRRLPSDFYNPTTGYRGPWAHAVMKGFYFASSNDPYQELQLHYVGDGLGAALEELEPEVGGLDEWDNPKPIDTEEIARKALRRKERFAQPRGLGTFSVL